MCMSLLETLSDRQIQIRHQRAANKELADKLERLQDRLLSVEGGEILVFPSRVIVVNKIEFSSFFSFPALQVIMGDYKEEPNAKEEEFKIPEEELRDKILRKQKRETREEKEKPEQVPSTSSYDNPDISEGDAQSMSLVIDRPKTPEYEELNRRFQSLLCSMNTSSHSEVSLDDEDDNVFHEPAPISGLVQLSCSRPPDILDFTRRSISDIDLEDVNITLDGIEIVSESEEELPSHIQDLVDKAMKEIQ